MDLLVQEFLDQVKTWAITQPDVRALALVGSHARDSASPDSDIDLVLIVERSELYLENLEWVREFGAVQDQALEDYGKVISIRVFYQSGLEVEFGVTGADWIAQPLDAGTRKVITDGTVVLLDRVGDLTNILHDI